MAQSVKPGEVKVSGFSLGTAAGTRRGKKALAGIARIAQKNPKAADRAALLLESVAEVLAEERAPAVMPAPERQSWEALGARFDAGAVDRAALRSRAAMAKLLADSVQGDAAVAALLGVDRSRVSQRLSERSVYVIDTGDQRLFPRWQFEGASTVPNLKAVLRALATDLHPLTVTHWFLTPSAELEVDGAATSPRDWLVTGGPAGPVVDLASLL
jgi:DNA-binding transcriptional regulator YdaS (Cro superfamily)